MPEVCKDREIEPKLTPLTGEELDSSTGNTTHEGRLDMKQDFACGGVWQWGQQAFLDLMIFDTNVWRNLNKPLQQCT